MNDTDMLPGSNPHRKYMVCMVWNIIQWRWEEVSRMRDERTTERTVKIELLSWRLSFAITKRCCSRFSPWNMRFPQILGLPMSARVSEITWHLLESPPARQSSQLPSEICCCNANKIFKENLFGTLDSHCNNGGWCINNRMVLYLPLACCIPNPSPPPRSSLPS